MLLFVQYVILGDNSGVQILSRKVISYLRLPVGILEFFIKVLRPVHTEQSDLLSVSVSVSDKIGLHSNMQKCLHWSVSMTVSNFISDTIGYHSYFFYLILTLILTWTLKLNHNVQCEQAVSSQKSGPVVRGHCNEPIMNINRTHNPFHCKNTSVWCYNK